MPESQDAEVDVLSLEDFRRSLDRRLSSAQTALNRLTGTLGDGVLKLGDFADANTTQATYKTNHQKHITELNRLISAIKAAQTATDTIIKNYRTTEARNKANAADIQATLDGVGDILSRKA